MREIKFRAWDKTNKKMVDVGHLTWNRGGVWGLSEINQEMPTWFDLMQFTGLKDKNGRKIYEGDVVRNYTDFNTTFHGNYVDYEVVYRSGMWVSSYLSSETGKKLPRGYTSGHMIDLKKDLSEEMYFTDYYETDLEVIGNIYENNELLEPK